MGRLLLYWDPEIDGAFRRRLERQLAELAIPFADASMVDPDPEAPAPAKIALASSRGGFSAPPDADLLVLAGPGEVSEARGALRLETSDIETRSKRWLAFEDRLARKLGRASLAASPEDLALQLEEAVRRADAAERMRGEFELQRNTAVQSARQAEAALASAQARIANLEQNIERQAALSEASAYALSHVREDVRMVVGAAREHAWRARLAAARAAEAADAHPDALAWPKAQATYAGETRNRVPHGRGVMVFRKGADEIARYAGEFAEGVREGHGVAVSDGGMVWCGEMKGDEAHGAGVLEAPDGRRFEGEVEPGEDGAPRPVRGHTWTAGPRLKAEPHRPLATALPAPRAASD